MKRGFSMFELLLVVGIAAVIFSIVMPVGISLYRAQLVEEVRSNIIEALQKARHNAVLQKGDTAYGVHVVAGSYTVFQGSTYATRNTDLDEVFPVVDSVTFTGREDIIFAKLTGLPAATGTIAINYNNLNRGIAVDASGGISKVDTVNGVEVITSTYSVSFDANGGTGTMSAQTFDSGATANLNANTYTRTSYSFAGWATSAGGAVAYANSASYTMGSANVTLYAKWITTPGAPTIGTATAGNATSSITFSAPASDGGVTITGYTVTSSPGGLTGTGSASPITVTGLTNGTSYTFTVTATNSVGTGPASSASNSVIPNVVSNGLVSYWSFDGNANDNWGSNNGTVVGAVATSGVRGLSNTAYAFDGVNDYIDAGDLGIPHTTGVSTMGFWLKTANVAQSKIPINYGGTSDGNRIHNCHLSHDTSGKMACGIVSTGGWSRYESSVLSNNVWYYFTLVNDISNSRFYFYQNGSLLNTGGTGYTGTFSDPNKLRLGNWINAGGYDFSGSIDNVRIYNRALLASEISDIYNAEKPIAPSAPTSVTAATSTGGQATVTYTPPVVDGGAIITSYTITSSPGGISTTTASTTAYVTGLSNGTAYTFTVTATNSVGTGPDSSASNSVTPHISPWYNSAWAYRTKITIDRTKVASSTGTLLANFPVLISTTSAMFKDTSNSGHVGQVDGGDIVFTSADGITKLDHEIESYTPASGNLVSWVEVPSVATTTNTDIYMYYGNASVANQWNASGTWDSNFKGVWHLSDAGNSTSTDSTGNGNNGTNNGVTATSSGQISGAGSFDGTNDYINFGPNLPITGLGTLTISSWFNANDLTDSSRGWAPFLRKDQADNNINPRIVFGLAGTDTGNQANQFYAGFSAGTGYSTSVLQTNTWYHAVMVFDGSQSGNSNRLKVYLNGTPLVLSFTGTVPATTESPAGNTRSGAILYSAQTRYFKGIIDNLAISSVARSADWIKTEYNNQSSPNTFYIISSEAAY